MMNDDQYLLASAYADGEVTPTERALAEADPAVMAEVDRLQALRRALSDVDTPADRERATMIATAMAEFDGAPAIAPVATREPARRTTPTVVTSRRPARWFSWERAAGLAAAAVVVVAIGAVVTNGTRGGDDDDSASIDMADAEFATEAAESAADRGAGATAVLDTPPDRDIALAPASADTVAAASTEAPEVLAAPFDEAQDAPESELAIAVIESPEQLAAAGVELRQAYAADSEQADDTMDTTVTTAECTFTAAVESPLAIPEAEQQRDELLELAERVEILDQRGYRVGPGDVRPALIAVDLDTGQAFAIDTTGCALLAIGPLP